MGWDPRVDIFNMQNTTYRGQHICARHQMGQCWETNCACTHICHICLVQHPAECPDATRWRRKQCGEDRPSGATPVAMPVRLITRIQLPDCICDDRVPRHSHTIVQQLDCVSTTVNGRAEALLAKWPHAMWQLRRAPMERQHGYAVPSDWDLPGSIEVHPSQQANEPTIINLFAQFGRGMPGVRRTIRYPEGVYDNPAQREHWFWQCLTCVSQLHDRPESIAFPHGIGCFQEGGRWDKYEAMIQRFASLNPDMKVIIVEKGGQANMICVGSMTAHSKDVEPGYQAEWWKHEPEAAIWWECPHGLVQVRGSLGPAPEGYYLDSEHTVHTPACRKPACVRYGKEEYAKLRPILSEPYWPEEGEDDQPHPHNASLQQRDNAVRKSDGPLANLAPEEHEYRRLTTNNRRKVLADPCGARCTLCFAAVTVRGDLVSTASPTVNCSECTYPCVIPTSLIPGSQPMRTLMRWRKLGYPQRRSSSDPIEAIPLPARGRQAGSDEGEEDQAASDNVAAQNFSAQNFFLAASRKNLAAPMPKLEIERKFQISQEKYEELLKTATDTPGVQHHDLYFDSATYQLSQRDWWLRWRDGRWDLKVSAQPCLDKDPPASTHFWELEDEALICQYLGITSLPSHEQQPEVISKAAFEAQLKDVDSGQFAADLISADGIPHLHFQLCANMHMQRFNIKSSEDERVTLALDTVTFNPSMPIEQAVEEKAELILCEVKIMLDDDKIETKRLAEMALDKEIDRLGLGDCPTGRSKLFTYLQQYSPGQYEIWLLRSDEQKLNSLLLKAECRWQQTRLQMPPVDVKLTKTAGSDEGNSSKEPVAG